MNLVLLVVSYLSGIFIATSGGQEITSTTVQLNGDTIPNNNENTISECDCTMAEFENISMTLDSCLSNKHEISNAFKTQIESLTSELKLTQKEGVDKESQHAVVLSEGQNEREKLQELVKSLQTEIEVSRKEGVDKESQHAVLSSERENERKKLQELVKSLQTEMEDLKKNHVSANKVLHIEVDEVRQGLSTCQENLVDKETKYETEIQTLNSKIDKLTKNEKRVKDLRIKLSSMGEEFETNKKALRSVQDKYHDSREEVTKLDRELRTMHHKARQTYFNTTLVKEDSIKFFHRSVDSSIYFVEDLVANPKVKSHFGKVSNVLGDKLGPINSFSRKYISPKLNAIGGKMKKIDAIEGVRLLLVSMIKEGSTVSFNYIQLTQGDNFLPRRLEMKYKRALKYTEKNAEYIVHTTFQVLLAYIVLKLFIGLLKFCFRKLRKSKTECKM